ncbi:MAG: hypothetical protein U5K54_18580 [Cytophagales bacterium]|nr:hypothetical protein [Cytophagales bacterium]
MTKEYDFSVFDITKHNFGFGDMTIEEIEARKKEWEDHQAAKASTSLRQQIQQVSSVKPVFKPRIKPLTKPE